MRTGLASLLTRLLPILLALLSVLILGELLHLLLQLFGLAAQHLLLPALLEALLRIVALLLCQLLLPPCQSIELLQRIVDLLLFLFLRRSGLRALVLVLCSIQFEIKQRGQIASHGPTATTASSTALAKGDLNLAEGRLSPQ